jgi:hypothetical protein
MLGWMGNSDRLLLDVLWVLYSAHDSMSAPTYPSNPIPTHLSLPPTQIRPNSPTLIHLDVPKFLPPPLFDFPLVVVVEYVAEFRMKSRVLHFNLISPTK